MAAFQQAGDFSVVPVNGQMIKNGGNVVSYFCTPEGRLIHAVGGPVTPERLLSEARWATDIAVEMRKNNRRSKADLLREAHQLASKSVHSGGNGTISWGGTSSFEQTRVHQLLANYAYLPMAQVETMLFRSLSGEPFESDRSAILNASRAFTNAEKRKRPVLLMLRSRTQNAMASNQWRQPPRPVLESNDYRVKRLLKKFEVVSMPKIQLAAFTNLKELKGWEELPVNAGRNWRGEDTYIVASPSGRILSHLEPGSSTEFSDQLISALELWDQELEKNPSGMVTSSL